MKNRFYTAFDLERMDGKKVEDAYRSCFQIDRDRVLHTPTFRKLQSKTQVFWSGEYDFYRTRLTHSLEVAQIGRSVCSFLNQTSEFLEEDYFIDGDLVEAVCLSHDLGHPPFGHAGEKTLNGLMGEDGGFEGNAQTLRLLTERIFTVKKSGMNPTRAFVDGVLKYKSLWSEMKGVKGRAPKNHFVYDEQSGFLDWVFGGRDFPMELGPGEARDGFKSIECQVMDWADDTAYSLNDLADSVRAGFLRIERIERWAEESGVDCGEGTPVGDLIHAIRRGKVEPMLGSRIGKYIQAVRLREDVNFMSGVTNRYRYVMEVDEAVRAESEVFKRLAYEVVFCSAELNQLEFKGDFMLRRLWGALEGEYIGEGRGYKLLPDDLGEEIRGVGDDGGKRRLLCDYLASLSDTEAGRMYERLFVPGVGSIGDLV